MRGESAHLEVERLIQFPVQVDFDAVPAQRPQVIVGKVESNHIAAAGELGFIDHKVRLHPFHIYRNPDGFQGGILGRIFQVNEGIKDCVLSEGGYPCAAIFTILKPRIADIGRAGAEFTGNR